MNQELWRMNQAGRRYETLLGQYQSFLKDISDLIEAKQVASLDLEGTDRRGFRFRYLGQSYLLRFDYAPQATVSLHAVDGLDDEKITLRKQLPLDEYGRATLPSSSYQPPLAHNAAMLLPVLLSD